MNAKTRKIKEDSEDPTAHLLPGSLENGNPKKTNRLQVQYQTILGNHFYL